LSNGWKKLRSADWGAALRGVYEYNIARHFRTLPPRGLVLDVTYRCNSRCVMCSIWNAELKPELSLDQFDQVLADPLFRSIERLMISGGEPSLRSDLPQLVQTCMRHMPALRTLSLITNGLLPERVLSLYGEIARLCAERGIQLSVSVSLDGLQETHDRMRGVPGAFARATQTLDGLRSLQAQPLGAFYLGVGSVICHLNLGQLGAFRAWCREQGLPPGFQIVGFHDTYVNNLEQQAALDFDEQDRPALYAVLQELAADRSLTNWMAGYWADMLHMYRDGRARSSPCPFQVDALVLDAYGNLRLCETADNIGNCLTDGSCSELYYGRRAAALRKAMPRGVCRTCNSGCMVNVGYRRQPWKHLRAILFGDRPAQAEGAK
jgi:MoaA/NifB/PqqE/SkfB family radical SAM enzyme